jgi:hypothetical protein
MPYGCDGQFLRAQPRLDLPLCQRPERVLALDESSPRRLPTLPE